MLERTTIVRVWFLVVVLAVCVSALYALDLRNTEIVRFYSDRLKQAHIREDVLVGGVAYTVQDGAVFAGNTTVHGAQEQRALRLAYAVTVARRSPIMSLEGSDPDEIFRALNRLQEIESSLADIQQTTLQKRAVQEALYPIAFLRAAAQLEKERQVFLKSRSDSDEALYRLAGEATVAAYLSDLNRFQEAFEATVPLSAGKLGIAGGRVLSRESELRALDLLRQEIGATRERLRLRDACIHGYTGACSPSDLALPGPFLETQPPVTIHPSYERARAISSLINAALGASDPPTFVAKPLNFSSNACVDSSSDNLFFEIDTRKGYGSVPYLALDFVGDILLMKTQDFAHMPYFKYFLSNDITYVPYWPTSSYTCPEFGPETGKAFMLYTIEKVARNKLFSANLKESAPRLARLEQALTERPYIREADAVAYLNGVRTSLIEDGSPDEGTVNSYISLALGLQDHSIKFADLLRRLITENATNLRHVGTDVPTELGAPYLFFVRSAFLALFMAGNASFIQNQVRPYEDARITGDALPYVSYYALTDVPRDKLMNDIRFVIRLESWDIK